MRSRSISRATAGEVNWALVDWINKREKGRSEENLKFHSLAFEVVLGLSSIVFARGILESPRRGDKKDGCGTKWRQYYSGREGNAIRVKVRV